MGLTALMGCSHGTTSSSNGYFYSSGTASQPDQVRMVSGGVSGDVVTVQVKITGPTTSSNLDAFSFDLLLSDPTVADYVDGSASAGAALDPEGTSQIDVHVIHDQQRVSIAVGTGGGSAGTGISAGSATIVSLRYRILKKGTSALQFAPDPSPMALNGAGVPVSSVTFDAAPSAIVAE
jgi:hypothetical protein